MRLSSLAFLSILLVSQAVAQSAFTGKPQYLIATKRAGIPLGTITVELFPTVAPKHSNNFDSLVSKAFYDSTAFHRVIPGFMIQGGDPNSRHGAKSTWGYGDTSQPTVPAEFSPISHQRGILSAARDTGINSANSQFFICVAPATWLNNQYSVYGRVVNGMNWVDTIVSEPRDGNDCPYKKIEMFVTYLGSNDSLCPVPVLNDPYNNQYGVNNNKQLKWNAVPGAIMYYAEVATDSNFTNKFLAKKAALPYVVAIGLPANTTFYWRVWATNGGNVSAFSPVWKFHTNFVGQAELNASNGYELQQNIPNPVSGKTTIKYVLPQKEKVVLKLLDISGRELAVMVNEERLKGEHEVVLDLSKYAAGVYFCSMEAGEFKEMRKMVVEK